MSKALWVALAILLAILIAGCASDGQSDAAPVLGSENNPVLVDVDGVDCVVIDGPGSVAVSCNWDAYNGRFGGVR